MCPGICVHLLLCRLKPVCQASGLMTEGGDAALLKPELPRRSLPIGRDGRLSLSKTSFGMTDCDSCVSGRRMFAFLARLLLVARSRLKSRASLEAENLVLRQQVIVLSRNSRSRVQLLNIDRLIFVWLYRFFPAISECDHRGQARNGYPVASVRLSGLLALEIPPTWWPPQDRPRDPRPDPTDE